MIKYKCELTIGYNADSTKEILDKVHSLYGKRKKINIRLPGCGCLSTIVFIYILFNLGKIWRMIDSMVEYLINL